jgi:hypothetical protein
MIVTAQQTEFLSWKVVPARLDASQAAWFLGFAPHEIPRIVTATCGEPWDVYHRMLHHAFQGFARRKNELPVGEAMFR